MCHMSVGITKLTDQVSNKREYGEFDRGLVKIWTDFKRSSVEEIAIQIFNCFYHLLLALSLLVDGGSSYDSIRNGNGNIFSTSDNRKFCVDNEILDFNMEATPDSGIQAF